MDVKLTANRLNVDGIIRRLEIENQRLREAADVQKWRANVLARKLAECTMKLKRLTGELQLKIEEVHLLNALSPIDLFLEWESNL